MTGALLCDGATTDPLTGTVPPATDCTEVKMVPASDGRNGGTPDPATAGPVMIQIGNEGGILPQVATIPAKPINYEYSRRVPTMLNVTDQSLLLMPAERADIIVDFSAFAGKTLILYNDAPAPMPLFDERNDLYTGSPDWTAVGGAPSTPPGYGPNTRTVMQINVCGTAQGCSAGSAFDLGGLQAALPRVYAASQAPPIVKQSAYNAAFGTANGNTYVQNVDATVSPTGVGQGVLSKGNTGKLEHFRIGSEGSKNQRPTHCGPAKQEGGNGVPRPKQGQKRRGDSAQRSSVQDSQRC